jgi:hypothetical protein
MRGKNDSILDFIKLTALIIQALASVVLVIVVCLWWLKVPSRIEVEASQSIQKMYSEMADSNSNFNQNFSKDVAAKMQVSIQKALEYKNKDLFKGNNQLQPIDGPFAENPLKKLDEKVIPVLNAIREKVDKLESDNGQSFAKLNDAASLLALGALKPQLSGRVTLPVLGLTQSLNLSKAEKLDLISKLMSVAPRHEEISKANVLSGKILVTNNFNPSKFLFASQNDLVQAEKWLASNDVDESRPAMDALPEVVSAALGSSSQLVERLVVVTNHEFRFRNTEFTNWDRFKSVAFVMLEGPIPEYFEWGHINKLKDFRKKGQGSETKIRIFKRQSDKGLSQEEMIDLSTIVRQLNYE